MGEEIYSSKEVLNQDAKQRVAHHLQTVKHGR